MKLFKFSFSALMPMRLTVSVPETVSPAPIAGSNNLWDFRRFDEESHWTIPKLKDVGNWVSFPATALAAAPVIEAPEMSGRLETLAVPHADTVFGRTPRLAAAPSQPDFGFTGIDCGCPLSQRENVCATEKTGH